MPRYELRSKCPRCNSERCLWGPWDAETPDEHDKMESQIDAQGSVEAMCPQCGVVEMVSLYVDGIQTEPWMDATTYEREGGPEAGPLPHRPWRVDPRKN